VRQRAVVPVRVVHSARPAPVDDLNKRGAPALPGKVVVDVRGQAEGRRTRQDSSDGTLVQDTRGEREERREGREKLQESFTVLRSRVREPQDSPAMGLARTSGHTKGNLLGSDGQIEVREQLHDVFHGSEK
jgi:hypothetical protein